MDFLAEHENIIRLTFFAGVLLLMALLETLFPRRGRTQRRRSRWSTNLALIVIDTMALRLLVPIVAMGMAAIAAEKGWGLFNLVSLPSWVEIAFAVIALDFLIYVQHVASHKIPLLWRLHQVHHADRDIDVTTGVRFHPVEIVLSMFYKVVCVLLLGPAVAAVFLFEVLLNACALFNHSNVRLPLRLDHLLRSFLVTPDMHRVHHSAVPTETNSNYGFSLSIWDRLFKTYVAQPRHGHDDMTIGLTEYQNPRPSQLVWSLVLPFRTQSHRSYSKHDNGEGHRS
ncbi:MAG: sterol desaturase family protein [Pseudomonadota bacterium]